MPACAAASTRNQCEENRRKVEIEITPKGLALLTELDPIVEKNHKQMERNMAKVLNSTCWYLASLSP